MRRRERKRERAKHGESTQGAKTSLDDFNAPPEKFGWVRPEGISLSVARTVEVLRTLADLVLRSKKFEA
jgi:hypothetical protein